MTVLHVSTDVAEFAAAAEAYLLADPVAHTYQLTTLARLRAAGPDGGASPRFGWLSDDAGAVVASVTSTPPFPLSLGTENPAYAAALAVGFPEAAGVIGPADAAHAFAAALGRPGRIHMSELQYRLDRLVVPASPPGAPRPVQGSADIDLAARWLEAFEAETGVVPSPGNPRDAVAGRLARGTLWFWSGGAQPVCMSGYVDSPGRVPRIGPVYTPPEQRGHGYAAALTAAVTKNALEHGAAAVTLFTDAANPASNSIYRRIGFREVARLVDLRFGDATAGSGSGR
jgi:GNAT superfamily N-acetyltransferase